MKSITRYIKTDAPVDYYTLGVSAARYKEIAIGYKKFNFSGKDDLIVITDGPGNDNNESRGSGEQKITKESA